LRPGQLPNIVSRWLREKEFIFEMTVHLRLTPSGRAAVKRGVKMGRKPSISQADRTKAVKLVSGGMPKAAVAKELGFSRQKLYDILKETG